MLSQDHQSRNETSPGLDEALTKLADILRAMGVEELSVDDNYQHHIVNNDIPANAPLVEAFCAQIQQLHASLPKGN